MVVDVLVDVEVELETVDVLVDVLVELEVDVALLVVEVELLVVEWVEAVDELVLLELVVE